MIVVYTIFMTIGKVIASFGPPYIIMKISDDDGKYTLAEMNRALQIYVQEGAKSLNIEPSFLMKSIIFNAIVVLPVMIIGYYLFRRREWARKGMIFMMAIFILSPAILNYSDLYTTMYLFNVNTIISLGMIWFYQRRQTKAIFVTGEI